MKKIILPLLFLNGINSYTQILTSNTYMKGNFVEIGLNNTIGVEGADTSVDPAPFGMHFRSTTQYFGYVANPQMDGWVNYNGDYFTPGSPEGGWGITIQDGTNDFNVGNNRSGSLNEITGSLTSYSATASEIIVVWDGNYTGTGYDLDFKITYHLGINDLYYSTKYEVTNNSGLTIDNFYLYKTLDPDNNMPINSDYVTTNTIVSQPILPSCCAKVSATQSVPWISYIALIGNNSNDRVTYGGFANRDASDIWNFVGYIGTVGSSALADQAMSISSKRTNFASGTTETIEFFTVFDASVIPVSTDTTLDMSYSGTGIIFENDIMDTVYRCNPGTVTMTVTGAPAPSYTWTWTPSAGLSGTTGTSVVATIADTSFYTATGIDAIAGDTAVFNMMLIATPTPDLVVTDPGPLCGNFDLNTLVFTDNNSVSPVDVGFYSSMPANASDTASEYSSLIVGPGDPVYLMAAVNPPGCYDAVPVVLTWINPVYTLSSTNTDCGGNSGTATITAGSGSDYTFVWENSSTFTTATGLSEGWITITVGDTSTATPCNVLDSVYVQEDSLIVTLAITNETCYLDNGAIAIATTNDPLVSFDWSTGATTSTISSLDSGYYSVTVFNAYGCYTTENAFVNSNPTSFTLTSYVNNSSCWSCTDGFILISVSGSVGAVTYSWSTGATTPNIYGLSQGMYILTVTDAGGCSSTDTFFVTSPIGMQEINASNNVSIYPNPANDRISLTSNLTMQSVTIYGIEGNIIKSVVINSNKFDLNIDELVSGAYMLNVQFIEGGNIRKVMLKE